MAEQINVLGRSPAAVLFMNALARTDKVQEAINAGKLAKGDADIPGKMELKCSLNGVEVDLLKAVNEAWNQLEAQRDSDVIKKAQGLLVESGLQPMMDKLEKAKTFLENYDFEMRETLGAAFEKQTGRKPVFWNASDDC